MSRTWTNWGFNEVAKKILSKNKKIGIQITSDYDLEGNLINETRKDLLVFDYDKEESLREDIWYRQELIHYRYKFSDGRILESYVQAEPQSSGPHTFLALRDAITKEPLLETLWPEETIDNV